MKLKHIAIPLLFLALTFFVLFVASLVVNLSGCHDPMLSYVQHRYPGCDVLKVEDADFGYQEITIQCPMSPPRVIKMKRRQ